jgi:hypothetical protein
MFFLIFVNRKQTIQPTMTKHGIHHHLFAGILGLLAVMFLLGHSACHEGDGDQLEATVDSFSSAYFNWQFVKALPYCTPDSKRWLSYLSSQVNQWDVDTLKAMKEGATVHRGDISYPDDSTAVVEVTVKHFLTMDTIGLVGQIRDEAKFRIPMVCRAGEWKVHLSQPLRPLAKKND